MSLCCSSVCLLVLLGAALVFGGPINVTLESVESTHDSIADVLKLKDPESNDNPLFRSVIRSINTSCQRKEQVQLMSATLDVYANFFQQIQHSSKLLTDLTEPSRTQVQSALIKLQHKMETLNKRLHHKNHNYEAILSELTGIKVDDPVNQRKALAQFKEVYQAASVIAGSGCGSTH